MFIGSNNALVFRMKQLAYRTKNTWNFYIHHSMAAPRKLILFLYLISVLNTCLLFHAHFHLFGRYPHIANFSLEHPRKDTSRKLHRTLIGLVYTLCTCVFMDALWKEEKMPYLPYFSVACYTNTVFIFYFLLYRKIAIALQTCFGPCVETPQLSIISEAPFSAFSSYLLPFLACTLLITFPFAVFPMFSFLSSLLQSPVVVCISFPLPSFPHASDYDSSCFMPVFTWTTSSSELICRPIYIGKNQNLKNLFFCCCTFTLPEKPITVRFFGKKSACVKTPESHPGFLVSGVHARLLAAFYHTSAQYVAGPGWFPRRSRPMWSTTRIIPARGERAITLAKKNSEKTGE